MSRKKIVTFVSIILLLIGLISQLFIVDWNNINLNLIINLIFYFLGIIGSILAIFIPSQYVNTFKENDWEKYDDGYLIKIPFKVHGMGKSPTIKVYIFEDNQYNRVMVGESSDINGNVTISSLSVFKGKYIISK